jgi:CHAT domain-containing protein/tetratricopeptide (TPR) repeat protein
MAAFTAAFLRHPRWTVSALLALLLYGCSAPEPPPRPILSERCLSVSTALPIALRVVTPGGGTLRIAIRQRGIAVTGSLPEGGANAVTVSPEDRYGVMTLLVDSPSSRAYSLRIISRDSPDIMGQACVSTELVDQSDRVRLGAERAFAAAGHATLARQWQAAFDDYLTAARGFDHFDRRRSGQARDAMAQLASRELDRNRDSYALAGLALQDIGASADPGLRSALVALQAAVLLESTDEKPQAQRERVLRLLDISKALAARASFGARELAWDTILQGFLEYRLGKYATAAGFFRQAEAQCSALRDGECAARAQQNLADIAQLTGNNAQALQGFTDALKILSPGVAPVLTADIWDNLGRLQGNIGLLSLGEQSQLQAIRLYAQIGDCDGVRRVLSTLGSILVHAGNVDDALVYLNRATSHDCAALLSIETSMAGQEFQPLRGIADASLDAEGHSDAPAQMSCSNLPAPASLSADSATTVFRALLAANEGARLKGDQALAERCLGAAGPYAITPRLELRLANAIGSAYLESGMAAQARQWFLRALADADQAGFAATNKNRDPTIIGLARASLLARRPDEARRYSSQALLLGSARADIGQVIGALQVLALSLRESGARTAAVATLRTAMDLIEQVPIDDLDAETRATYLATQHAVFEDLTDDLVAEAQPAAAGGALQSSVWSAFSVSERGRARSWQYALSQAAHIDPPASRARLPVTYQELLPRIAALAASITSGADWSAAAGSLQSAVARGRQTSFEPMLAAPLLAELDRLDATLVEYASGRDDMYAFVIDGGAIHVVSLGKRKRIALAAADLNTHLHDADSADADIQRAARPLAQLVLWPLTRYMKKARVIFVADDSLHTVPFAVLPWSPDPQGALVLQHAETSVVSSTLFMLRHLDAGSAVSGAPRFELIGDPIFQSAAWRHNCSGADVAPSVSPNAAAGGAPDWTEFLPPLPGSRDEVLAIAELARASSPSSHIGVHLGCMATPNVLRQAAAAGFDLLHIATHGYVDALRPRLSALVFTRESATSPASGVLDLLDILAVKTSARLVVLSACDTSRGRLLPGEGVLGPAQAFLQSGAASVVASYWRIDDAATVSFMRTFYKYLLTERLPVATALRRAQLDESSHGGAHNWAGFALFGWPDGVL